MHSFTTKLLYFFPYENKIGVLTRGGLERQDCLGWFSVICVIEAWKLNEERRALKLWSKKVDLKKRWQLNPTWIHIISFRNLIQTTSLLDSRLTKVHWKALKITWVVTLFCPSDFFFKCAFILICSYGGKPSCLVLDLGVLMNQLNTPFLKVAYQHY